MSDRAVDEATTSARTTDVKEPWRAEAACRGLPVEVFFPRNGGTPADAVAVCSGCEVQARCLVEALAEEGSAHASDRHGVRGGLGANDRSLMARLLGQSDRRLSKRRRNPTRHEHRAPGPPSRSSYVWGCRCGDCCEFEDAYQRARYRRDLAARHRWPEPPSRVGYLTGCRCTGCCDAPAIPQGYAPGIPQATSATMAS